MKALERVQAPVDAIAGNREGPPVKAVQAPVAGVKAELNVQTLLEMDDDVIQRVIRMKGLRLKMGDEENEENEDLDASLDML